VDGAIKLVGCSSFGNAALTGDGTGEIRLLHVPEGYHEAVRNITQVIDSKRTNRGTTG
jgi:hypothetical protein